MQFFYIHSVMCKTLSGLYDISADHITGVTFSGNYIDNFEDYLLGILV